MAIGLLVAMLVLPWGACLALLRTGAETARQGRRTVLYTTLSIGAGCLALLIMRAEPALSFASSSMSTLSAATLSELAWTADRFSVVMVAATMLTLSAAIVLLPDEAPAVWMVSLMIIGCVLQLWWLQHVWWIAGATVVLSFLMLVLPAAGAAPNSAGLARSLWLTVTVGHLALITAIIAGIGGLGTGDVHRFGDPEAVHEFAAMRPATALFVGLWWWIGILGRAGQFPLCVALDQVRTYRPLAWVMAIGVGVFTIGWRWCDLGHAWWVASPSVFNLVVSGALASALLCAWFALSTADFRLRVAYLAAAQLSLALGPLSTGIAVERISAAAVVLGTIGLAVWCWCVVTSPESPSSAGDEAGPAWARVMTGGDVSTVVWQWTLSPRAIVSPVLPLLAPSARAMAPVVVLLWCTLSVVVGSWWWSDVPMIERKEARAMSSTGSTAMDNAVPVRPNGSIPVSALAVSLTALGIAAGMR